MQYIPPSTVLVPIPKNKEQRTRLHAHRWPIRSISTVKCTHWSILYAEPPASTIPLWEEAQRYVLQETLRKLAALDVTDQVAITLIRMDGQTKRCSLPRETNAGELRAQVSSWLGIGKHDQDLHIGMSEDAAAMDGNGVGNILTVYVPPLAGDAYAITLKAENRVWVIKNVHAGRAARFKSQLHFGTTDSSGPPLDCWLYKAGAFVGVVYP